MKQTPKHIQERFERARASLWPQKPPQKRPKKRAFAIPAALALGVGFLIVSGMTMDTRARGPADSILFNMPEPRAEPIRYRRKATKKRTKGTLAARPIQARTLHGYGKFIFRASPGITFKGVHPVLVAKGRELMSKCGSKLVSAKNGRRNRSLHPIGRAIDMTDNPKCMARVLRGWRGGLTTDYWAVKRISGIPHFHISWGGWEHGKRFAHRGYRTRIARSW